MVNKILLLISAIHIFSFSKFIRHFRQMLIKLFDNHICTPKKHTRIPSKFARCKKYFCHFYIRFLSKSLHFAQIITSLTQLDITIPCFWTCRFHTKCKKRIIICYKTQTFGNHTLKLFLISNQMIRWQYHNISFRILLLNTIYSIRNTRSSVATHRLKQHLIFL